MSVSNKSTPSKLTKRDYKTLEKIVEFPEKNMTTIGVILDSTGNYKTDDSYDYVNKIKIIDPTHYSNKDKNSKIEPYVMIFIFTSKLKETPVIRKIGDIILLRNFFFDNYQNMVKGIYKKSKSEWQLFDSRPNSTLIPIAGSKKYPSGLSQQEQEKIKELKKWSLHFFTNNSVFDNSWFSSKFPKKLDHDTIYKLKDVDLIVKVLGCVKCYVDDTFYAKIVFVDKDKKLYFSELKDMSTDVEIGSVVKLRSIQIYYCNKMYRIDFFNYSDILKLQDFFKDTRNVLEATKDLKYDLELLENQFLEEFHLEKYVKKNLGNNTYVFVEPNHTNQEVLHQKFLVQFPLLKNFELDRRIFRELSTKKNRVSNIVGSLIMKKHADLTLMNINELVELFRKINKKKGNALFLENKSKVFKIRAKLKNIKFTSIEEVAKIYSVSKKKLCELRKKKNLEKDSKIIYYNIFTFSDNTQIRNNDLQVYLASFDGNPQFIFDLWRILPDIKDVESFCNLKKDAKNQFEKNMKSLLNGEKEFDIVVQLAKNEKNKYYYRMIDTIFWFQN